MVSQGAVSFSWSGGSAGTSTTAANISTGLCSAGGLRFVLPSSALARHGLGATRKGEGDVGGSTLTIWAGARGGTLRVNASLGGQPVYLEELHAAPPGSGSPKGDSWVCPFLLSNTGGRACGFRTQPLPLRFT